MPELPEIETIKLQLQKQLIGQTIISLEKLHPKSVQGNLKLIQNKKVVDVERKGKMLILKLNNGLNIAVHFKMTGQLILQKSLPAQTGNIKNQISLPRRQAGKTQIKNQIDKENNSDRIVGGPARNTLQRVAGGHPTQDWIGDLPSKHTRAIFHFASRDVMYFNDQRIFGWIKIFDDKQLQGLTFLKNLGKEPWDITDEDFFNLISKKKKAIKLIIMDQEILSGVGNIYANDALWEAGIDPRKIGKMIRQEDGKKLRLGIIKVLKEGIKYGGATAPDNKYINLQGKGGKYQEHFRVYEREGKKCLRNDGGIIKKIKLGGRGTYFCDVCQK